MTTHLIPFYKYINKQIVKAQGCYLYDSDDKNYLDFESGDWAANLGHSREEINVIIKTQVDKLIHDGLRFRNKESEELAIKLLNKLSLINGKCVFLNSGSEAVNLGITLARNLTGRKKILKMDCSFLSSFGYGKISPENQDLLNIPMDDTDYISKINFTEIAAFVFEPGNSGGLIKFPTNDFIHAVASAVKQKGGLLMANEVTTGYGRTGKWFGFQHYDYKPDIVATGKAMGNGYPLSCVSISEIISELFDKNPFRHAQSHQNDALGCAVGLSVINLFDKQDIVNQCYHTGQYFMAQLINLQKLFPGKIKEIRGRGLMLAMELFADINIEDIDDKLLGAGFNVGIKNQVIRFMPPLIIVKNEVDRLIEMLERVFKS